MTIKTKKDTYNTVKIEQAICTNKKYKGKNEQEIRVDSRIYTDGNIIEITEEKPKNIYTYKNRNIVYSNLIDIVIARNVKIKNARYILVIYTTKEWKNNEWHEIIKDIEIHLNNKKDIEALYNAKRTLKMISSKATNIFEKELTTSKNYKDLPYNTYSKNVYMLKK